MSRKAAQSIINWKALAERVSPNQQPSYIAFKGKSESYLQKAHANPEVPPKLNWDFYKKNIGVEGMVKDFKSQYTALKIPYPEDTYTSDILKQEEKVQGEIESFKRSSKSRIKKHEKAIIHLESLIPFDQMTMEDYCEAFPDDAIDPIGRPTFWPHNPEEQLCYKKPN